MAISLNNHETRIKTLEDGVGKGSFEILWKGSSSNITIPRFAEFPAFLVDCLWSNNSTYPGGGAFVYIPTNLSPHRVGFIHSGLIHTEIIANGSTISIRVHAGSARINSIIGLKLCYNFSYNIYNKFYFVKFTLVRLFVQQYNRKTFYNAFKCYLDSLSHKRGVNRCLNKGTC